ncbi:MAG TPA: GNAT family N-acetyltransferase [Reyranella sp.]|nr:GNAT family N-acetyltransferase [Reyranella sp.]
MTIDEISRDALTGDLETMVQALLVEAFREGSSTDGDYYARHGVPDRILIAREAQQVVGHLALYRRPVKMGDEVLEIGMIGAVAVAPDHRRRGHCRRLLRRAHDDLRARSIPFSILFAFEPRVYLSSGYRLMQNETHFLDADGAWKSLVYRGSMYAELAERPWPNRMLELAGGVV